MFGPVPVPMLVEPANRVVVDGDVGRVGNDRHVFGGRPLLARFVEKRSCNAHRVRYCVRCIPRIAAGGEKLTFAQDGIPPMEPIWDAQ